MDISGPLRNLLRQHLPAAPSAAEDAFCFAARLVMGEQVTAPPAALAETARPAHQLLALATQLRVLPRVGRDLRDQLAGRLTVAVKTFTEKNQKLFFSRAAMPVEQLWFYWLLVLGRQRLRLGVQETQLRVLWQNAWTRQTAEGTLHPVGDGSLDAATYNDLVALHVSYNAVLLTRNFDLFVPVQRLADFHVERTQPDHVTGEPWGLAAFAALDATNTFAGQQLHDATTWLAGGAGVNPVILGLLADALMAQEEAAEA